MKVNREDLALHVNKNIDIEGVAFNFITITHHDSEGVGGLGTKAQGPNQVCMHIVMYASSINQNNHILVRNTTH